MNKRILTWMIVLLSILLVGCTMTPSTEGGESTTAETEWNFHGPSNAILRGPMTIEEAAKEASALAVLEYVGVNEALETSLEKAPGVFEYRVISCVFGDIQRETITVLTKGYNWIQFGLGRKGGDWGQPELTVGTRYIMLLKPSADYGTELVFDQAGWFLVPYDDVDAGQGMYGTPLKELVDGKQVTDGTTGEEFLNYVYSLMQDNEPFDEETWLSEQTTEEETTVAETMDPDRQEFFSIVYSPECNVFRGTI